MTKPDTIGNSIALDVPGMNQPGYGPGRHPDDSSDIPDGQQMFKFRFSGQVLLVPDFLLMLPTVFTMAFIHLSLCLSHYLRNDLSVCGSI